MLKITFYPNDEARIVGTYTDNFMHSVPFTRRHKTTIGHAAAEELKNSLIEQSREGTIEAQIVTIRKAGAYVIPKQNKINDVFNSLV